MRAGRADPPVVAYLRLIKSKQTQLLVITGWAGYSSTSCPWHHWTTTAGVIASLFMVISGCTVLNMVLDRDIDAKMSRTCHRPLPVGDISINQAIILGIVLSVLGIGWAFSMAPLYGWMVSAGFLIDLLVYTFLLKRRTAYSVVFGGVSGGMPILAGRALGVGGVDLIGLALAMTILFWIPTHIMTFQIRCGDDYRRAGIPTFPQRYGIVVTRALIAVSTVVAVGLAVFVASSIGVQTGCLGLLVILSALLVLWSVASVVRPSPRLNFGLFKAASAYMLGAMLLIALGA